ncbi:MAG: flavin-containing amine oxidoreductase [Candidatus Pelagibacter sp.]|nr:flavin-containing amine oxidoreductase [Candidatus Pelagibacter sp.]
MKIAVIGSGISGLSAAYNLSKKYNVDLFEKNDHFGVHSYTYDIKENNRKVPVDLGFIVFNELTYPNLINFFKKLKVPYEKSDMSFSVSVKDSTIEYGGKGFNALFARKNNLFNFNFIKMIYEIVSFYKIAPILLKKDLNNITLGNYLDSSKLSKYFVNYHIIPMVAAIWSMPFSKARDIPLELFLNFFNNHGLFKLKNRPQWYTVTNRSRTYVSKVLEKINGDYFKNYKIKKISRSEHNVRLFFDSSVDYRDYDHVILSCHADESLKLIDKPTRDEEEILKEFTYISNTAYLHTDTNLMPNKKNAWSSWNSLSKKDLTKTCVTYWLNKLQNLETKENYFLTINPICDVEKSKIIKKINFTHPYLNIKSFQMQKRLNTLQGKKRIWFSGSYFGYGFHEDGLNSSLEMLKQFEGKDGDLHIQGYSYASKI